MSSPTSSPVKIIRPVRTYGRRKPSETSDAQTPLSKALIADTSPSVSNTSPTNSVSHDDVPPSSDDAGFGDTSFNDDDDDDSHGESDVRDTLSDGMDEVAGSSKYARRSLKDALAQIDEQFDNEDMDVDPSDTRPTGSEEKGRPLSKGIASGSVSDDPFDGPASKPTASRLVEQDGASPPRVARRLAKQTRYLNDSDSESPAEQAQTSAHSSPEALHPINTPNTHSSPTPPTSQDMAPVSVKQKGKARQRSHSAEEDDSDGMLPTVRSSKTRSGRTSKGKRVKAPTKKELLETQKATARIKADQRPTLPRRENKLRISSLFEKLSNGLRGLPSHEPTPENPSALHSDPIQPFSSSPARPTETFIARPSTLRPQPSRSSSNTTKPTSRHFVPSGLLGDEEDEAESSSKPPRTPTKAQDDVFQSNGLLDGTGGSPAPDGMSDDEEMPSVGQILNEANKEKEQAEIQRKLREAKLQYLQKQQQQAVDDEDDSDLEIVNDDMHTVAKEEDKDRRSRKAKHIGESVGRQKQLTAAGKASLIRSPTKTSTLRGGKRDFEILSAAAAPLFSETLSKARKGKGRGDAHVNQKDLNQLLLHASDKQSRELTAQKEAEFAKRVGQRREEEPSVDKAGLLEMLARRSRENRAREDSSDGDDEGEGDEENDRDWMPDAENENDMDEDGDISEGMTDLPIATDDDVGALDAEDDDDENDENIPMRAGRSAGRPRAVFDSDDDEDGENRPATGRILVAGSSVVLEPPADLEVPHPMLSHRSSVSSMSERLEEGTDKENDFRLMFDRGDDKENTAVASQSGSTVVSPLAALRGGSGIFSLPSLGRTASTSSVLGLNPAPAGEERSPLQELPTGDEDEDVFLTPSTKQTMHRPSSSKSPLLSQSLSPLQFRSSGKGKGLSSLFEDDEAAGPSSTPGAPAFSLEPAADIRPGGGGLSQFFAASGQAGASPAPVQLGKPIGFSQFMTPIKPTEPSGSRPSGDLALTLGQSLQPALEVDENLLRQADNIFEKEQEFIVEEGARVPRSAAKPLFINRHGFLTQTKPPSSPASPAFAVAGPSVTRQPLSTIALSRMSEGEDEEDEEENLRPRRLRRRSSTPEKLQGYRSSPSPSPAKPRNAFDLLGHKPSRIKAPQFEKKRLMDRNEFIEGEAEESDEDAGFGFGVPKKKDEEEELDGEDQDQVLEELVDDAHMDDDTLNEERVLEKVQEHRALDDAADEKIARDAAEGKMRVKRRNNLLDFDDDESDEESWEAKRARERMAKKRRIEGDTLEQIEKNPETQAFAAAYRVDDDEDEFAHLDHEDTSFFGLPDGGRGVDDDDDEDSDGEEREVVDASALREQLQRVARGEETVETIDVDDVQWLNADDDDDMDNVRTRELDVSHKQPFGAAASNDMEWDLMKPRRDLTSEDLARQQKWARSEGSTRNIGTGRASAVTGMNKSAKIGSGSMPNRRKGLAGPPTASSTQGAKKVAKAPSVLSAVSGRRSRFA